MRKIKKDSKNSRGLSLIEVLIGLSIMTFITVGVGTAVLQMMRAQKKMEDKIETTEVAVGLSKYLKGESFCAASLAGKRVSSTPLPLSLPNFIEQGSTDKIQANKVIFERIKINSITAVLNTNIASSLTKFEGADAREVMVDIVLKMSRRNLESDVPDQWVEVPTKEFALPVKTQGGVVVSCDYLSSQEASCSSVGGVWNSVTKECKPEAQCKNMGAYISWTCTNVRNPVHSSLCGKTLIDLNGSTGSFNNPRSGRTVIGGIRNVLTNAAGCPSGSTGFHTGTDQHSYTGLNCGKKCAYTAAQRADFYNCMDCN